MRALSQQVFHARLWAAESAYWVGYFAICRDVVGVVYPSDIDRRLRIWERLARAGGWWFPCNGIVFCAERHAAIHFDDAGRLHGATGPAIVCRDGYKLYACHGTRVPARVIEQPESFTAEEIQKLNNTEIVRALAERLGWSRFLQKLGSMKVDAWTDPNTGLEYELHDIKIARTTARCLRKQSSVLKDGTQPFYFEPVPETIKTAKAARKWQAMAAYLSEGDQDGALELVKHCNNNSELRYTWEA